MKIRMLGTGYGDCKIKKKSVKDFRHKGGVLVDEKILIDAPDDIFAAAEQLGFSDMFDKVFDIIISHSHPGHFSPDAILRLAQRKAVRIYASDAVLSAVPDSDNIEKIEIMPFSPTEIGEYRLIPTPTNHETENIGEECLNFVLAKDKILFYALDGGYLNYGAWKLLSELKLDALITECALENQGASKRSMVHNNLSSIKNVKEILMSAGICTEQTRFIATHIPTDKKRSIHDELTELAADSGITVAYDGYFFSF